MDFDITVLQPYFPIILSSIISIITLVFSVFSAKYYGERTVELAKRRRDHSIVLNEATLNPWLANLYSCSGLFADSPQMMEGVIVTRNMKFKPRKPCDPKLEFFEYAKQHLQTGYPNMIREWADLKRDVLSFNEHLVGFLKSLNKAITKEMKAKASKEPKHWSYGEKIRYVRLYFAQSVYIELESVLTTGKRRIRNLEKEDKSEGAQRSCKLIYEGITIYCGNRVRDLKKGQILFDKLVSSQDNIKEVEKIVKEKEVVTRKLQGFEKNLEELHDSIKLGNILKGKCRHCPEHV